MSNEHYKHLWLLFVNIKAEKGKKMEDLVESAKKIKGKPIGAWANVIIKSDSIENAMKILPIGLREKSFDVVFVDKVENIYTLIDNKELAREFIEDANWLLSSNYIFKISGDMFLYMK